MNAWGRRARTHRGRPVARRTQADPAANATRAVTPGHEIVATVVGLGAEVVGHSVGDRVGVAWLRTTGRSCGTCRYCLRGA